MGATGNFHYKSRDSGRERSNLGVGKPGRKDLKGVVERVSAVEKKIGAYELSQFPKS
jgi:hypothetical protein